MACSSASRLAQALSETEKGKESEYGAQRNDPFHLYLQMRGLTVIPMSGSIPGRQRREAGARPLKRRPATVE